MNGADQEISRVRESRSGGRSRGKTELVRLRHAGKRRVSRDAVASRMWRC